MHTQQVRPWPAIDLAELRFGIAFGSSVEELPTFFGAMWKTSNRSGQPNFYDLHRGSERCDL